MAQPSCHQGDAQNCFFQANQLWRSMVRPPQAHSAPAKAPATKAIGEASKFHSATQISRALQSTEVHDLKECESLDSQRGLANYFAALHSLRNQFTVKSNEYPVNPLDGRFLLAKSYAELKPGFPELCNLFAAYPSVSRPVKVFRYSHCDCNPEL